MNNRKRLLVFLMLATASVLAGVLAIDSSALAAETCGYKGPLQMVEMKPLYIALRHGLVAGLDDVVRLEENKKETQNSESQSPASATQSSPDSIIAMSSTAGEIEIQPSSEASSVASGSDSFGLQAMSSIFDSSVVPSARSSMPTSKLTKRIEAFNDGIAMVQSAFSGAQNGLKRLTRIRPFPLGNVGLPAAGGSDLENPASEL